MRSTLQSVFGLEDFRPGQEEIIRAVLAGRDVLAVMATGSGKSLCYQLPAIVSEKRCLVISPLISLMNDQVGRLHSLKVPVATSHSGLDWEKSAAACAAWRDKKLRLYYISPERVAIPDFFSFLKQNPPDYVAIDEAHCISQWGHDFREEYRDLGRIRSVLGVPVIAVTATATPRVQKEIVSSLALKTPLVCVHGFYRSNLKLSIRMEKRKKRAESLAHFLADIKSGAAIVYAATRKSVNELTDIFCRSGLSTFPYHAGLSSEDRENAHRHFREDPRVIIVATNAFGMGVDRPDVRLVAHAHMPGSLEAYYQEAGRAGRDGLPAECLLFFDETDTAIHEYFIGQSLLSIPPERREAWKSLREGQLDLMLQYALSGVCRQKTLMDYFGDIEPLPDPCGSCDHCAKKKVSKTVDPQLWEAIRKWRADAARKKNVPAYTLFWNRTIDDLCLKQPRTLSELHAVFGMGERKCASFGAELLRIIGEKNDGFPLSRE
ncbi:MAG: RecQ family ATP-dependent DNA helicase [Deltaproteobacteria bacterium]|nr:RecQ family ATP-dependent DNA helicase [Deltaproteobacteria bacterium]